ncbi:hypothetical protein NS365_22580 [Aureimonas ureilytica]|uniref:Uncharacterized protein n=1 Tax=Aureimonas ureilytica TaxID=401562 RepID=A0A175RGV6_9HYPH|nr:hypothetical protein [Aureimonas ureilytica]KTR02069.1 hypothetical protein NS365_22580 [Aureimonas ureilytica]
MIDWLAHRLELAEGADLAIDHALLDWLADGVGLGHSPAWLVHVRSLTGDATGALGILDEVFPDAAYSLVRGNGSTHRFTLLPAGDGRPYTAEARHPANAVIAAVLRAFAADAAHSLQPIERAAG